jgi:predicted acylesterase/phospholipase RssA
MAHQYNTNNNQISHPITGATMKVMIQLQKWFLYFIAVLIVMQALVPGVTATAKAAGESETPETYQRPHVRPISVTAQLDYCRSLLEMKEGSATISSCVRYAAVVLDEGMRMRDSLPRQNEEFVATLEEGVQEISARLEELAAGDGKRLQKDLDELDEMISELQLDLSRIAAAEHVQLSLVSRGGVSLGNWQAGFLYWVTEWAKTRRGHGAGSSESDPAFRTVTGASAGAVNGFVAAIEGCKPPNPSASGSLYYRVWIDLGLFGRHGEPGLFPGEEGGSTAISLFTNAALDAGLSKATSYIQEGGQLAPCSVDFGFVTTHLDPAQSPVHVRQDGDPILTTKKLKEKFTVRLDFVDEASGGSASGSTRLRITNIGPPDTIKSDQVYYAGLGHTQDIALQSLMLGVRASGAFPGAFPPVSLAYTQYVPGPEGGLRRKKRLATFIDGGILDNTPVGLAVTLDSWRADSAPLSPHLDGLLPPEPRAYVFLEPLVTSWVRGGEQREEARQGERDLFKTYLGFAGDLLATTTDAQLTNTAEQFPFVRRESRDWTRPRLSVPERHMPITGAQFEHFMAFLERDFRIFDFYVGMADAYAYLEREECLLAPEGQDCVSSENLRRLDATLKDANPNYRCIRAYYDSEDSQVLKRMTTSRLPLQCRELTEVVCDAGSEPDSPESVAAFLASGAVLSEAGPDACSAPAIANHNFRALLAGMHNYKVWMQSDQYAAGYELDRFFEELSSGEPKERFIYIDLSTYLQRDEGYLEMAEVRQAFRELIQTSLDQLASEQPGMSEYALLLGGRAVADTTFGKEYPKRIFGVGIVNSGVELDYGRRLGRSPWRWDSTFRIFNLEKQNFGADLNPFTGEFYLSTQGTRIMSPSAFFDVELGAGWAASETVAFSSPNSGHIAFRSGPRTYLGLVILQRIFVTINVDFYPIQDTGDGYRDDVVDDWEFNLSAGWRFLD